MEVIEEHRHRSEPKPSPSPSPSSRSPAPSPMLDSDSTTCLTDPLPLPGPYATSDAGHCERQQVPSDDAGRLRLMGYDQVLGRPLGFWGSTAMSICQLNFVNDWATHALAYGYNGPILFVIGYPIAFLFHMVLLGPFAEFSSAYPVAGAMATWSWRTARRGVRNERGWGWLVSGLVLAMHVGRVIGSQITLVLTLTDIYVFITGAETDPHTGIPLDPERWWHPVFHLAMVTVVAVLILTRVCNSSAFWIAAFVFNMGFFISTFTDGVMMGVKTRNDGYSVNWGFPTRNEWTRNFSWMMFTGLPFKVLSVDCPAHMSEETVNPSKNVPRVMYTSTIFHFIFTYLMTLSYILWATPPLGPLASISTILSTIKILHFSNGLCYFITIWGILCAVTQHVSTVIVTSRFIFAQARDYGIPFSNFFMKTTKKKEPWAADLGIIITMYISVIAWFDNQSRIYNLARSFAWWFTSVGYIVPLGLYLVSKLDLEEENTMFTLRKWSRPFALVSVMYLLFTIIEGSFPYSMFSVTGLPGLKVDTISALPMVIGGTLISILITWLLYGHKHYIGPIRVIARLDPTVKIDPKLYLTPRGRLSAILTYDTMAVSSHGPIFSFLGKLFSRKPAAVDTVELRESKWPSGNKDAKGSAKLPSFSSGNGGREKSGATGAPPDSYLGQSRRATHGHFDPTRTSHHPTTTTLPALAESGLEPAFEPTRTYSQYAYPPDLEQERQRERQQTETMLSTHSGREMHALAESQLDPTATVDMSFLDPHNGYYASPYAYGTHSQSQSQVDQFDELDRDRLSPRPRGQEPRPPQRLSSPPTPIAEERGKENPLVPEHFAW